MTGAEFSGVDLDLLADYVGGALDGTPDEAVVAALITEDAAWRDAHARLAAGVTAVAGQLRGLGSVTEPMPADIFARLDAALLDAARLDAPLLDATLLYPARDDRVTHSDPAALDDRVTHDDHATRDDHSARDDYAAGDVHLAGGGSVAGSLRMAGEGAAGNKSAASTDSAAGDESVAPLTDDVVVGRATGAGRKTSIEDVTSGATAGPAAMEPGSDGAAPVRHLVAVPSGSRGKRQRRLRWAAPAGIAAGVLAFAGFAFQQTGGESSESAGSAADAPAAAPAAPRAAGDQGLALPSGSAQIIETGTDYRLGTLGQSSDRVLLAPDLSQEQTDGKRKAAPSASVIGAVDPLARLRAQEALRACIEAIAAQHGVGEIAPQTIDFARFDGAPAVVVKFTAADGSWVWASGPDCGMSGVGAASLGSVRVG